MTRQYEPCEHRLNAVDPDAYYTTPCDICESAAKDSIAAHLAGFVLLMAVVVLVGWWLS